MITNYYTLKALADAWNSALRGYIIGDIYSQSKDEITFALASQETTSLLRAGIRAPFQYLFRAEGYNKARRNVATLFKPAFDGAVEQIRLAERDRILIIELDNGFRLQLILFGPRANVVLVDAAGFIVEAFQRNDSLEGTPAPVPAPAPVVDQFEVFMDRWNPQASSVTRAITRAFPFLNATLAKEVATRAGITATKPSACSEKDLKRIYSSAQLLEQALLSPNPRIYWDKKRAVVLSLADLTEFEDLQAERFIDIDKAVSVYVRKRLGQQGFDTVFRPLEKALSSAYDQASRRLEKMLESLAEESRADRYERWGHLLMAAPSAIPARVEVIELDDLFDDNNRVAIPLAPELSAVENAQRYYEKARQTRQSRAHAEERLEWVEHQQQEALSLLNQLRSLQTRAQVLQFQKNESERLVHFLGQQAGDALPQIPFRRYELGQGYELWVGKNARQNDELTFNAARKFDLWLHARGVAGSHAVLRLPGRTSQPDKSILEKAASIAAYHSKARGSHLVPVIITEKKYVRKPRGAAPGAVVVEREQVLIVEPAGS